MVTYFYRYWLPTGKWSQWETCSKDVYESAQTFDGWEVKTEQVA